MVQSMLPTPAPPAEQKVDMSTTEGGICVTVEARVWTLDQLDRLRHRLDSVRCALVELDRLGVLCSGRGGQ